jgi:hypothetical protein
VNVLQEILSIIALAAEAAQAVPNVEVDAGALLAEKLVQIAQKSIAAHQAVAGKPIDLSALKAIEPVA